MHDRLQLQAQELKRLETMLLIRRFEERAFAIYASPRFLPDGRREQRIGGFCHLCSGQEAIAVGASEVFRRETDVYVGSFRCHGWSLALGMTPRAAMAELFGRATGCCRGKGGSMHFADAANGNLGGWNVAASQMPIGAGAAFAAAYRKSGGMALIVFGDGAVNQGAWAETMNLASLLKLPAVFLLEDNGIAMFTKVERHSADPDLAGRARAFAMPCRAFDGNDVEEVIRQVSEAADRARRGEGPTFLAARTFRFCGFSMSDPMKYRTKEEVEKAKPRDPITLYTSVLKSRGVLSDAMVQQMHDRVVAEIEEAVDFAEFSPDPLLDDRWTDVTDL